MSIRSSYDPRMTKRALSVTLTPDNIAFLRARTLKTGARSVSETLDTLVSEARTSSASVHPVTSIKGLASIAAEDPDLAGADEAVRRLFALEAPSRTRRRRSARG